MKKEETELILTAVGEYVRQQFARLEEVRGPVSNITTPSVQIRNEITGPLPNVAVTNEVHPAPAIVEVNPPEIPVVFHAPPITVLPAPVHVHNAEPDLSALTAVLTRLADGQDALVEAVLRLADREGREPPKAFRLTTDGKGNKRIIAEG